MSQKKTSVFTSPFSEWMRWIVCKISEIEKQQVPLKYFWSCTKCFRRSVSTMGKTDFFIIPQKVIQKLWPKRKTSQPIFWTFLNNFLSQNLVLTCNISHLWRKRTLFLNEFLRNVMIKKKHKNLVAMFYVLVRTFVLFFLGWRKNPFYPYLRHFYKKFL